MERWRCGCVLQQKEWMWGLHSGASIILPGDKENANKSFFTAGHGSELKTE